MKEAAPPHQGNTPLPQPTDAQRQLQRKYYIMRRKSFQAMSDHIKGRKRNL
jgi:hypothetical protein